MDNILLFRSPTEPPPGKEPCVNSWGFYFLLPTMGLLWMEFGFTVTNLSTLFFNFLSFGPRKAVETAFQKLIQNFSKFIPYLVNSLHSPETRVWDPAIPKSSSALLRSALRVKRDLEVSRWPHVNWQHDFIDWFNLRSCASVHLFLSEIAAKLSSRLSRSKACFSSKSSARACNY